MIQDRLRRQLKSVIVYAQSRRTQSHTGNHKLGTRVKASCKTTERDISNKTEDEPRRS